MRCLQAGGCAEVLHDAAQFLIREAVLHPGIFRAEFHDFIPHIHALDALCDEMGQTGKLLLAEAETDFAP